MGPTYGYWAVLLFVAIQCAGIPWPGETMLLAAAIYAGTTHHLHLALVVAAAAAGAIVGYTVGFWAGRAGGYALLRRYGRLDERRLKLGQYLFLAVRAGGYVWGSTEFQRAGVIQTAATAVGVRVILVLVVYLHGNTRRLEEAAERALPGPLAAEQDPGPWHRSE